MKRLVPLLTLAAVGVAFVPAAAPAQDEGGGELVHLIKWEVNPADAAKWTEGIQKIVAAAKQAQLSNDYSWSFYQENIFEYRLVYPIKNMAYFDDEMAWMRQFEGTPGQAPLMAAFQQLNATAATTVSNLVTQSVPGWGYETGMDMANLPVAHVDEIWLKPGVEEQYDALMKEFMAFVKEMGYPYPMMGFRPRIGGTGEHHIVTWFDSRENFYGENNLDRMIEAKGAQERWTGMLGRFTQLITRAHHFDSDYRPDMSYSVQQQAAVGSSQ